MQAGKRSREDMDEGARKKFKTSRRGERSNASPPTNTVIDLSSDRDVPAQVAPPAAPTQDSESFKALQLLHADFDSLRSLITCKICERLLYEPYVLSCGHTYCYSCLSTWFQGKKKKTCPNCRDDVRHMPAPSYVIKEMTTVFVGRAELLPEGETIEQHAQWQKEESDIVQNDKADEDPRTGGLFRGSFRPTVQRAGPIMDREDNVERCPECHWELEDGYCNVCQTHVEDDIGSDDDISDDVSDELDDEDEIDEDDFDLHDAEFGHPQAYDAGIYGGGSPNHLHFHTYVPNNLYNLPRRYDRVMGDSDDEDESEDDDDDDHSLHGFIDDEADVSDASDAQTRTSEIDGHSSTQSTPRRRRRLVVLDSDDEDASNFASAGAYHERPPYPEEREESDSSSDIVNSRPNPQSRRAPPITIVDSDDEDLESDSDDETSGDQESDDEGSNRRNQDMEGDSPPLHHESDSELNSNDVFSDDETGVDDAYLRDEQSGFSPIQPFSDDEQGSYDEDDDDEDVVTERFQWPGRLNRFVAASTLRRSHLVSSLRTGNHFPIHPQNSIAHVSGNSNPNSAPTHNAPIQSAASIRPSFHAAQRHPRNAAPSTLPPPYSLLSTYRTVIGNRPATGRSHAPVHGPGSRNHVENGGVSGSASIPLHTDQYSVSAESVDSETGSDSDDASSSETMGRYKPPLVPGTREHWGVHSGGIIGPLRTLPIPFGRPELFPGQADEIQRYPVAHNSTAATQRPMTFEEMFQHRRSQRSNNAAPALPPFNRRAVPPPLSGRTTCPSLPSRVAKKPRPSATVVDLVSDDEPV